ncbi:hypothetical protein [Massilia pseudoviolaceinigra]|uniref:hypothetical protein n=1 Tax=Massilia pseudoviolaceinigra TaxID=3057165 RepID=UPI00279652EA|nr:hypothetical protein [Massilia sp. CCM 9206]MDQ1919146.1 hypothetical protein [Massilia sp. CCM 9206]
MACLAVFGRGPNGGALTNDHYQTMKLNPDIARDIYVVAGIDTFTPVTIGTQNFRYGGTGTTDTSFVCPEPTCRPCLPTILSQLGHNVAKATLLAPILAQPHIAGAAKITASNFVHRTATNVNQHRGYVFNLGPPGGADIAFNIYHTFTHDVYDLVMQSGAALWRARIPRVHCNLLQDLVHSGFNIAPAGAGAPLNSYVIVPSLGMPVLPPAFLLTITDLMKYQNCLSPERDLANYQYMCPPCNASKNAGGVPLDRITRY